jgi:serine/threonine protein kinase
MPETDRLRSVLADRYRIERELGSGGMATVYLARDIKHDREVALKVLRSDLSAVIGTERFLAEVRITAKLDHPHILTLIDSGEADGILYYVLPYVRGESLRARIDREKQLSIDEAVGITKQIASALDYAHSHGVVHRDIKPENILLHEGEAVLADFGIALAVKEAGGNRLTETGLSLGTPQYMSPEQATGERTLDKRTDIYSLGAVFYEMIAGEPPVTGATAQVMIAKLLTERPVKLRVVRDTVAPGMERAADKALAKIPADRFSSAGEFARALSAATVEEMKPVDKRSMMPWIIAATAAVAVIAIASWALLGRKSQVAFTPVRLVNKTQVTTIGNLQSPTISADGKTLAYVVNECGDKGCRYAIEMQDVTGGPSRRIIDGATAIYGVEISPDRRYLMFTGSYGGRYGGYLVSTLGGDPKHLPYPRISFYSNGDSLLLARAGVDGPVHWLLVAGLDAVPVDSIKVDVPAERISLVTSIPGSTRIAYGVGKGLNTQIFIAERNGARLSSLTLPRSSVRGIGASTDALWIPLADAASGKISLTRRPLDAASGKISERADTVWSGRPTNFSVTSDGGTIVYDEGASEYAAWKMSFDDLIKGKFSPEKRFLTSTSSISYGLAQDGSYILIGRNRVDIGGMNFAAIPWGGGSEIQIPGKHVGARVIDSTNAVYVDQLPDKVIASAIRFRTSTPVAKLTIPSHDINDMERLQDGGWAWIEYQTAKFHIARDGESRDRIINGPPWYSQIFLEIASPDGQHIAFAGWNKPIEDSLGIGVVSVPEGKSEHLWSTFGENASLGWLDDGSLLIVLYDTPQSLSVYRTKIGSGKIEKMGVVARPMSGFYVSSDLKRAIAVTVDRRGDAYTSKVVK